MIRFLKSIKWTTPLECVKNLFYTIFFCLLVMMGCVFIDLIVANLVRLFVK